MTQNKTGIKRNLSYTTFGMILYNVAIWALNALTLRMLGDTAAGYYAIALTVANPLYAVALWGLRSYIAADTDETIDYFDFVIVRGIGIVLGCIAMVVYLAVMQYSGPIMLTVVLYSIFKFAETTIELLDCFNQQRLNMDINGKSMIMRGLFFVVAFYLCLLVTKSLTVGLIAIIVITIAVLILYNGKKTFDQISIVMKYSNKRVFAILKDCFPIMLFELISTVIVAIPRLHYEQIGSLELLGIYVSIYSFITFLQLVVNVLIFTLSPYMSKAYAANDVRSFVKYLAILFLGALGLGLLAEIMTYLFGNQVIGLIYGSEYAGYASYLYWGIVSGVTLTFTWIFSQLFVVFKKFYAQLICSGISLIGCILLSMVMLNNDPNTISIVGVLSNSIFVIVAIVILTLKNKKKETIPVEPPVAEQTPENQSSDATVSV